MSGLTLNRFHGRTPELWHKMADESFSAANLEKGTLTFQKSWLFTWWPGKSEKSGAGPNPPMEKCMNQLIFAIGDIHGEMFLLHQLVKQCFAHAKAQETEAHFVFLGDYIDRGPRSNEVIAFLRKLPNATCLRGNHDHMMCEAVIHKIRDSKYWWLNNGGLRTIESYAAPNYSPEMVMEYASILADAHWLASLPVSFEDGHRFFCHAGIRPGVPLAEQSDDDLMWIREEFTACHFMHPKLIVHGHTPCLSGPQVRPNRVGIDTGGYFKNGQLTAAVFDETQAEPINFISVER